MVRSPLGQMSEHGVWSAHVRGLVQHGPEWSHLEVCLV